MNNRWGLAVAATSLLLALLARRFLFGLVTVHTASMEPAIVAGTTMWFSRLARPKPGDIVVVQLPDDPDLLHVKRVAAIGPAEVELVEGRLYVDGVRVSGEAHPLRWHNADCVQKEVSGIEERGTLVERAGDHERASVLADEAFLLGDRRSRSEDSRQWGPVRLDLVKGVVGGVAWGAPSCEPEAGGRS